jgi:hypothetical protein
MNSMHPYSLRAFQKYQKGDKTHDLENFNATYKQKHTNKTRHCKNAGPANR